MANGSTGRELAPLKRTERLSAGGLGVLLLAVALVLVVWPPGKQVALGGCANAAAGCIVTVDSDLTSFAAILAGIGAAAVLISVLGVRFNRLKVVGTELTYERETEGLAKAAPVGPGAAIELPEPDPQVIHDDVPVKVDVRQGLGTVTHTAPVAVTELTTSIRDVDPHLLRDYQSARRVSQNSHFLTHLLGPATLPGQKYSVAIRVTPREDANARVVSADFYLGRAWGHRIFEGRPGPDGRFGISTEAYGAFLALCEVEFDNGDRILLDHYCDFDMGSLLDK
jgi:hypothetical protein